MSARLKLLLRGLLPGILSLPLLAHPVSRIGGGFIGSARTGFEAAIPSVFQSGFDEEKNLLTLQGYPAFTGKGFIPQWVLLKDFDLQYPDLVKLSAAELDAHLREQGFKEIATSHDCIRAWSKRTFSAETLLLAWGPGKGVVATSNRTPLAQEGLQRILSTIQLTRDVCEWK